MQGTRRARTEAGRALAALPLPVRFSVVAALSLGVVGGIAGLVVGLISHPPTAWFAVLEVGAPAAFLGAVVGLLAGSAAYLVRRGRPTSHLS